MVAKADADNFVSDKGGIQYESTICSARDHVRWEDDHYVNKANDNRPKR